MNFFIDMFWSEYHLKHLNIFVGLKKHNYSY